MTDKVKIGGTVYRIEKTDKAIANRDNHILTGRTVYSSDLIQIYSGTIDDMPTREQSMEVTMWHEILHCVCHDRSIEFGDREESVIEAMAHGLHALIKDNPDLFKEM